MSFRFAVLCLILLACAPLHTGAQQPAQQKHVPVVTPNSSVPAGPSSLREMLPTSPVPSIASDSLLFPESERNHSFSLIQPDALRASIGRPGGCGSSGDLSSAHPSMMSLGNCDPKVLSPGGKLVLAMKRTFYPLPLLYSAAGAGISQARDSDPGFGQGAKGYGRRFGDRIGTRGIKELTGTFMLASALKMDPQYHPSSSRGFAHRLGSVLSQVLVTRTDSGKRQFNFPSVVGAAIGVGVSNAWRTESDRKASYSAIRFVLSFAFDAASNFFTEFIACRKHPRS